MGGLANDNALSYYSYHNLHSTQQREVTMAISERLRTWLNTSKVRYTTAKHSVAYTAQEIAAAQHVPGRQLAKSVLVKTDRGPILAVLPAIHLIDLKKLKALVGAKTVGIAKEADIKQQFPDVEVGAMSPFGNVYGVPVVTDKAWGEADEIVFNGGSHTETIKMRYRDFATLVHPKVGAFGIPIGGPPPRRKAKTPTTKRSTRASPRPRAKQPRFTTTARRAKKRPSR